MRAEGRLYTGIGWLDSVVGGFAAPELVLIDSSSPFVRGLLSGLCVQATTSYGNEMVFVDGGNSADPYEIARIARFRGLKPEDVLGRINVARGFTAYQLAAIINEQLEEIVRSTEASTVVISSFMDLFLDKDMRWGESFQLVKRCMGTLQRLTRQYGLVSIVSNHGARKLHRSGSLNRIMSNMPDRVLRMENRDVGMLITLPRTGTYFYRYPVAQGQTILDKYVREAGYGQDRWNV